MSAEHQHFELDVDLKEKETRNTNLAGVYLGGGKLKTGEYKALVEFDGIPTAARAINALLQTPEVDRVLALVPLEEQVRPFILTSCGKEVVYREPGEKFTGTVKVALEEIKPNENAVVLFSDIPFVRPASISRLVTSVSDQEIVFPAVRKSDVEEIQQLHNLHFMPCHEGYFHFGSALFLTHAAIDRLKVNELQEMYDGKSFRTNGRKKLEVARKMIGYEGLAAAIRIWISANLQHKNAVGIDSSIPSPSLRDYERMLSKLLNIDSTILLGNFTDLFLDYDYQDDTTKMQRDFASIEQTLGRS